MFADYVKILPIILPVTIITCIMQAIETGIRTRSGITTSYGNVGGYLSGGLVFGAIAILVYRWMAVRWVEQAGQYYLWLALGSAVFFSVIAVVFRFFFKDAPWFMWILIHILWAVPYGWYLPKLLSK
jgi:hypothetical protein